MALAVSVLALVAMGLQYRLVEARMMEASRALLTADLDGFAALYDQRRIIALRQAIEYRAAARTGGEMLLLLDRNGVVLAGTDLAWPGALSVAGQGFSADGAVVFEQSGSRWLAVARALPGGFEMLVARSLAPLDGTLASLRRGMAALGLVLLASGAMVGWGAARWVMRRIGRLNGLADRVAAGDLAARLAGSRSRDEFGLLETHVHAMLDRIENLNHATHRLSDTIAHELRTPLNRLMQKLALIKDQPEVTAALRDEIRQTIRVFDSLLDISRAEADQGTGGGLVPVDLSAVTQEMWDLYEPLAEDKGLVCRSAVQPGLQVLGDRNLIAQMVANILDNAIKYCSAGDALTLGLTAGPDRHQMVFSDTGPGLPDEMKTDAFERFTRAERDIGRGIKGHGLGLALVRAIAARHGAKLQTPLVEKGFELSIGWPKLLS
jgi:signal transduction histidine kinase